MDASITCSSPINQLDKPLKGIVIDNKDPLMLRRVKVKIEGLFEGVDPDGLPWASPAGGSGGTGRRANIGSFSVPKLYSTVSISFPNNDIYTPVYSDHTDEVTDAQIHRLFANNYPNVEGEIKEDGSWTRKDDTEGWIEDRHSSGRYVRTDKNGNVYINIPKNLVLKIGGQCIFSIADLFAILTGSDFGITVGREFGVDAASTIGLKGGGGIALQGTHTYLQDGVTYGTASSAKSVLDSAISNLNSLLSDLNQLKSVIDAKGTASKEGVTEYANAMKGTKKE